MEAPSTPGPLYFTHSNIFRMFSIKYGLATCIILTTSYLFLGSYVEPISPDIESNEMSWSHFREEVFMRMLHLISRARPVR